MTTASLIPDDLQAGIAEPTIIQEPQQPQIAAVTNGGVGIVPNSITDGPLVHMGMYIIIASSPSPRPLSVLTPELT